MPRLTRGQVADRLSLSVSSVRRLEREGVLTPELGEGGVRMFSKHQVEGLRAQRQREPLSDDESSPAVANTLAPTDGALAALAFAHFDQGETPIEVVQALELPPAIAKALYQQWRELAGLSTEGW